MLGPPPQRRGVPLLRELVESKLVERTDASRAFAEAADLEFVELVDLQLDPPCGGRRARRPGAPDGCRAGRLGGTAGSSSRPSDPTNVIALDDLRVLTGAEIKVVYAARRDIEDKLAKVYRVEGELGDISAGHRRHADAGGRGRLLARRLARGRADRPVRQPADQPGGPDRASDIHVEPTETDLRVRYRIDGVLHEMMRSPKKIQAGVISRLKIMADINIAERRVPQDGRMSVNLDGTKIDLRVATLPTVWGEKVVLRILDNKTALLSLNELGFSDGNLSRYSEAYTKPYGMILVTGPTGSGKSTTLYATLNIVSQPEINVITVEDPVEYRLPGINQVQVNAKAGLTFARALRSILRADPDVVLIGEIRDAETAQIAVEAALTGHLVLTTLHTNDAPSAVNRLVEMGIEPFLVGSAMDCVLAQRLCRRLCAKCKEAVPADRAGAARRRLPVGARAGAAHAVPPGRLRDCSHTGYRGRMALHEVMAVTEEIERLTVDALVHRRDRPRRAGRRDGAAARGRLAEGPRRATPRSRRSSASSSDATDRSDSPGHVLWGSASRKRRSAPIPGVRSKPYQGGSSWCRSQLRTAPAPEAHSASMGRDAAVLDQSRTRLLLDELLEQRPRAAGLRPAPVRRRAAEHPRPRSRCSRWRATSPCTPTASSGRLRGADQPPARPVRGGPRAGLRVHAARQGPVPRERHAAARRGLGRVPGRPVGDQDPGRARACPSAWRRSPGCRAAWCWSPARPARASRPRSPRWWTSPTAPATATS